MPAGPPKGNTNAEKWNFEDSKKLFLDAIELTNKKETINNVNGYSFDFIGDVARELNTFHHIFRHLVNRFPDLKTLHTALLGRLETNCYYNGKRGFIKEASSIMNLKSNHKWTDRHDWTTQGDKIEGINYVNPGNKDE